MVRNLTIFNNRKSIYCISLEESIDRQVPLSSSFGRHRDKVLLYKIEIVLIVPFRMRVETFCCHHH